ncbi:MAG: NUDIX domain-containing protein [Myxococcota bacterium]
MCVVLVPVERNGALGLLTIRRGTGSGHGKLALVGGFLEAHETWRAGSAREVYEETGLSVEAGDLRARNFASTEPDHRFIILFAECPVQTLPTPLPPLPVQEETTERGLVFGPGDLRSVFAFELHVAEAEAFFAERSITGPHRFTRF